MGMDSSTGVSLLVLRNLRTAPIRTTTVVVAIAVIVSLVFSTTVLAIGVGRSTSLGAARFGADLMILPTVTPGAYTNLKVTQPIFVVPPSGQHLNGSVQLEIRGISGVDAVSAQLYVTALNTTTGSSSQLRLVAFDPQTDFTIRPWLTPGAKTDLDGNSALAGSATGLRPGGEVSWGGATLTVVGVLEPTNSSVDGTVFFPMSTAYEVAQNRSARTQFRSGEVSGLMVRLAQGASLQDVDQRLKASLPPYTSVQPAEVARQTRVDTAGIATYELLIAGVMGGSVIILIALIFSMTVNERRRHLGLLRSFGATKGFVFGSVFIEAALMALLGGVTGVGLGEAVLMLAGNYVEGAFGVTLLPLSSLEMSLLGVISVLTGVGVGAAGAAYPVWLATRVDPYDAIRRG